MEFSQRWIAIERPGYSTDQCSFEPISFSYHRGVNVVTFTVIQVQNVTKTETALIYEVFLYRVRSNFLDQYVSCYERDAHRNILDVIIT